MASWSTAPPDYLVAFSQLLVAACHCPPAFSQAALVLYCEKSEDIPPLVEGLVGGLAEGDVVDELSGEPELDEPEPDTLGLLELPLGLFVSGPPDVPP